MSDGNKAMAVRTMDRPRAHTITNATLTINGGTANVKIVATGAVNLDKIVSSWREGRRLHLSADAGNSGDVTIRDNQSGSNLAVNSTSIVLGPLDSVWLRATLTSGGAEIWAQDSAVVDIS